MYKFQGDCCGIVACTALTNFQQAKEHTNTRRPEVERLPEVAQNDWQTEKLKAQKI